MKLSFLTTITLSSAIELFAANSSPFDTGKDVFNPDINAPTKEQAFTSEPMLKINGDKITVNQNVLNNNLFKECLQLVEYMYFGTKRYEEYSRIYEDAFKNEGTRKPDLYQTITQTNKITIASSFLGNNGGIQITDVGLLAYRKTDQLLQLFIIWEGSQGESFEVLGGKGGPSWLTNFQAGKVTTDAKQGFDAFKLDKKYLLNGNGMLSFHKGYYNKISTSEFKKIFNETLEHDLGIKSMSETDTSSSGLALKKAIDNSRGFTVQVYILGHSQGGGLVQVAAPYYTTYIGQYLYGPNFDNKTFNTVHAICLSPARAIGNEYTLKVVQRVMGEGNIFGYCSPMDPVPCVPLGDNIDDHKVAGIGFTILRKLAGLISHFVSKSLAPLLEAVSSVKCHYEDLPIFAYEDPADLLKRYCELSLDTLKNVKDSDEKRKPLEKIQDNMSDIKKYLEKIQKNYFNSHKGGIKQPIYLGKCVNNLRKLFNKCSMSNYIASQHLGAKALLKYQDYQKNNKEQISTLFSHKMLEGDVQKAINKGIEYKKEKEKYVK